MSKIWVLMLLASITTLLFIDPSRAVSAMITGSHAAVNLAISLVALYAFWLGLFAIIDKLGLADKLAKLLRPLVRFLFPSLQPEAAKYITMNMSANLLGLGNASTPMAIRAIKAMEDTGSDRASVNMIMLVVISCTSLQLLPSTVIGMRATLGSANPTDFLPACIAATVTSTVIGVTLVKVIGLIKRAIAKRRPAKATAAGAVTAAGAAGKAGAAKTAKPEKGGIFAFFKRKRV